MPRRPTLPAFAEAVASWFPELQGRAIAVSEADVFKEKSNLPTLPLAMVALARNAYGRAVRGNSGGDNVNTVILQMYFKPMRYRLGDGSAKNAESPFYAYFDYEAIEDVLQHHCRQWVSPRGGRMQIESMDIESDDFAVTFSFQLSHSYKYCEPDEDTPYAQPLPASPIQFASIAVSAWHPALCNCSPVQLDCQTCKEAKFTP